MALSADGSTPDDRALREEMAASFFVKLLDNPSAEMQDILDAWRMQDPRNAVAYARIAAAWDASAGLKSIAPSPEHDARPIKSGGPHGGDQ